MTEISYNEATAAQKLADAIKKFGVSIGGVQESAVLEGPQLLQVLADAAELIDNLRGVKPRSHIKVDIFWERQGWYFHETKNPNIVSVEYEDIDACIRAAHDQGYDIREVRRTRGHVKQPQPPVPQRKPNDAE